jgi:hypothetical protein
MDIDHSTWLVRGGIRFVRTTLNGTGIALRCDAEKRNNYLNPTTLARVS